MEGLLANPSLFSPSEKVEPPTVAFVGLTEIYGYLDIEVAKAALQGMTPHSIGALLSAAGTYVAQFRAVNSYNFCHKEGLRGMARELYQQLKQADAPKLNDQVAVLEAQVATLNAQVVREKKRLTALELEKTVFSTSLQ